MLLAFRFLTGFFGSPALATGGATIADMYRPQKQAYGLAIWGIGAVCGPVLGPLVGGFATMAEGWTWTIWELMWLSGVCFVVLFFFLPETSSPNILYRRTKRLRKLTGNDKLTCEPELIGAEMKPKDVSIRQVMGYYQPLMFPPDHRDVSRQAHYAQLHRTHRIPAQPLHRPNLRSSLHLVRVLSLGIRRDLWFQLGRNGARFPWHPRWHSGLPRGSVSLELLVPREAIRRQGQCRSRETSHACHGRLLLRTHLPLLVRMERAPQPPLDYADHWVRLLRCGGILLIQCSATISQRRVPRLGCKCTGG